MEQIIAEKPRLLRAYITKSFQDFMMTYTTEYHLDRIKNDIHINSLYPTEDIESTCLTDKEELRETRVLSSDLDPGLDFLIFNDKVAILSMRDQFATVMESPALSESKSKFFDLAWANSRPI